MASKSFRIAASEEVVKFDINGQEFNCVSRLAAGVIMRFGEIMGSDDESTPGGVLITAMKDFFRAVIDPAQIDEFFALLDDPDIAIPVDTLAEIAGWLSEQYTSRPTGSPSSDTSPPKTTGPTSTDGPKQGRTTYSRPTPVAVST